VKIATYAEPKAALKSGGTPGWRTIEADHSTWTADEREALASALVSRSDPSYHWPASPNRQAQADQSVPEADLYLLSTPLNAEPIDRSLIDSAGLRAWARGEAARIAEQLKKRAEAKAEHDKKIEQEAKQSQALADHIVALAEAPSAPAGWRAIYYSGPTGHPIRGRSGECWNPDGDPETRICWAPIGQLDWETIGSRLDAQIAVARRAWEKLKQREKDAEEQAASAIQQARTHIVSTLGTPDQIERHASGVLPHDELLDLVRSLAWANLSDMPRFERITDSEVGGGDIRYKKEALTELSAKEYADLKRVRCALDGVMIALFQCVVSVEPQKHKARSYDDDSLPEIERHSLHVSVKIPAADLEVSRLLALPCSR
jgi:hypothetical protein